MADRTPSPATIVATSSADSASETAPACAPASAASDAASAAAAPVSEAATSTTSAAAAAPAPAARAPYVLPKGRLYQSPDEIFATGMRARAAELGGDAALLDRAAVHILLELIRELTNYAEDFPDDPPISDADVDECMSELDFEGEGIETIPVDVFLEYAQGYYSAVRMALS